MGVFDRFRNRKQKKEEPAQLPRYLYDDKEIEELDRYICEEFGDYKNVFHEIASPDVHLDVCIVDPTEERPYYQLVTMGAGAYTMRIPGQWERYHLERAEYVISLPADWNLDSSEEKDYWPVRVLKDVARLPIWYDTWLAYGHTTQADEDGSPYAPDTRLNSVVLNFARTRSGDSRLVLSSGKVINYYEIIPLYPEELAFKMENRAEALFEKFEEKGIPFRVLDRNRKSALQD